MIRRTKTSFLPHLHKQNDLSSNDAPNDSTQKRVSLGDEPAGSRHAALAPRRSWLELLGSRRPPGAVLRTILRIRLFCHSSHPVGVPVGIADVAARRSATYLNPELVDGLQSD